MCPYCKGKRLYCFFEKNDTIPEITDRRYKIIWVQKIVPI